MMTNHNAAAMLFESGLSLEDIANKVALREEQRGTLDLTADEMKEQLRQQIENLKREREEMDQKRSATRELITQAKAATWAC